MLILLVDDEVELVNSLQRRLSQEGYQVDVAYDGAAAAKLLHLDSDATPTHPYNLLVLDWMLPYQSGLALCQQIRSHGDPTPILFLTAKDTLDDRVKGLDMGADDYLMKPFELRELLARIRALLRRPVTLADAGGPLSTSPLHYQDLYLDPACQVVHCLGQSVHLSEKEVRLLQLFMRCPGQLLTHDQIYQHLWPTGEKPSSNVLAAQVRLLRRKIEGITSAEPAFIQSVYGKGYRFGQSL